MRIALFHNLLSGGAKRTLYEITKRLSARHPIDVYTLSCANHDFADLRPHVARYQVFNFRPTPLLSFPFARLNQAIRLMDLLRLKPLSKVIADKMERDGYDVVLVHPCQFENNPSILSRLRRIPTVYYCHEPLRLLYEEMPVRPYDHRGSIPHQVLDRVDPLPFLYHLILKRRDRQNIRHARAVLVNSEYVRNAVRSIYQVEAQVSYHGVDTQFFQPIPEEKRSGVLSVGSLTPLKGFDFLIRSLSRIPVGQRPALVIASNFENARERAFLEHLALDLGVTLNLLGAVSDECLVKLYRQAALTLYAPIREPFGLVALESMACGTPLVAVREGGVQETIVHGRVGLLVGRDETHFAEAVQYLLGRPALVSEYGRNGREQVVHNWTWDRAASNLENHLASSLALG